MTSDQGARDASSFIQQLCDTSSVRSFCSPTASNPILRPSPYACLAQTLEPLLAIVSVSAALNAEDDVVSNAQAANIIVATLKALLDSIPQAPNPAIVEVVAFVVKTGHTHLTPGKYGVRDSDFNTHEELLVLDAMNDRSALDLLGLAMKAIAVRTALDNDIRALRKTATAESSGSQYKGLKNNDQHENSPERFISLLVKLFRNRLSQVEQFSLFNLWLEKLFLLARSSCPIVARDSVESGILSWLACCTSLPSDSDEEARDLRNLCIGFGSSAATKESDRFAMAESWIQPRGDGRHLWSFPSILSPSDLTQNFRTLNHLTMRQAYSSAAKTTETLRRTNITHASPFDPIGLLDLKLKHAEKPYLLLSVSRSNILKDTFDQLWQRRRSELLLPIRVRLGEGSSPASKDQDWLEIGQDLGGVQIEFFNAFCAAAFAPEAGMFHDLEDSGGLSWFRPGSLQPLYMFELVGLVLGLAVYNGVTLPIALPRVFYRDLLNVAIGEETVQLASPALLELAPHAAALLIRDGWPAQSRSLQSILDLESEEEVNELGLDGSFPFEANGLRISAELPSILSQTAGRFVLRSTAMEDRNAASIVGDGSLPGWLLEPSIEEFRPVTALNRGDYVRNYSLWLTHLSVAPQLHAFRKGFLNVFEKSHALEIFSGSPLILRKLIEGSPHLNLNALRAATRYQGYDEKDAYIRLFWSVVASWPEPKQLKLLKFVTAAERLPIGGAASVMFQISTTAAELEGISGGMGRLPTTSTCFGTLFLPKYESMVVLERKLEAAIEWGGVGFGVG